MNRIFITGGAGFIGSHTCFNLLDKGYHIVVLDSYINSSPESLNKISNFLKERDKKVNLKIFEGDIRDQVLLDSIFINCIKEGKPITDVIHFAGLKSVSESITNPINYWDVNVYGTIKLIEVMRRNKCFSLVFSSSATIYQNTKNEKLHENSPIKPINPYGMTKITIENFLNDIYKSEPNKWKIINLRYFNPIGAHDSGIIGETPKGMPNNIFPKLMDVAENNKRHLKIFGNDWPTEDGTCIRDYIHIMDLAEGHVAALRNLNEDNSQFNSYNLGTGKGSSVLELINTFQKVNKISINYHFTKRRKGDLYKVVADNSLAVEKLKWKPTKNLEEMCIDGWNWKINQNKN